MSLVSKILRDGAGKMLVESQCHAWSYSSNLGCAIATGLEWQTDCLVQGCVQGRTEWMAWLSSGPSRIAEVPLSMTTEVAATATGLPLMPTPSSATVQYLQDPFFVMRCHGSLALLFVPSGSCRHALVHLRYLQVLLLCPCMLVTVV